MSRSCRCVLNEICCLEECMPEDAKCTKARRFLIGNTKFFFDDEPEEKEKEEEEEEVHKESIQNIFLAFIDGKQKLLLKEGSEFICVINYNDQIKLSYIVRDINAPLVERYVTVYQLESDYPEITGSFIGYVKIKYTSYFVFDDK
jgi:hypothetical protein